MIDIRPPPPQRFELRVIVWGVRDIPIKDEFTNQVRPRRAARRAAV